MNELIHRDFGKHSNIPDCCIDYFINVWQKNEFWRSIDGCKRRQLQHRLEKRHKINRQYVACDKCLKNNYYQVLHECTNECNEYRQKLKEI